MPDTINQPGIRCHIPNALDTGHKVVWPGFTDACDISRFVRVRFNLSQSDFRWVWLENPGIAADSVCALCPPGIWRFKKEVFPIINEVVLHLTAQFVPPDNWSVGAIANVAYASQLTGPILEEQWSSILVGSSRGNHMLTSCVRIFPPATSCSGIGPLNFSFHPSDCGISKPGPTISDPPI